MRTTKPGPKRRRIWKWLALSVLVLIAIIAALPWYLGTAPARRWLLSRANEALAPAKLEFATIRFSWFRPTRLTGFAIRDAEGEPALAAPTATWDRNLRQILLDRPRFGTLELHQARLDVERRANGTIDLFEAIKPVLGKNRRTDLHIRMPNARLRFRNAGQPVPVTADRADLVLDIPAAPAPLVWDLALENAEGRRAARLAVQGRFERWKSPRTLAVDVKAQHWPWAFSARDLDSAGRLDGQVALKGHAGEWSVSGDAGLVDVDLAGPRLAGDHLRLDQVKSTWNVTTGTEGLVVHRLDLTSPLGTLQASGQRPKSAQAVALVEGTLDLAALARQIPHALRLREGITLDQGSARFRVESSDSPRDAQAAGGQERRPGWNFEARISDLRAQDRDRDRQITLQEPAALAGRLVRHDRALALETLELKSAFLNVTGQGDVDRGVEWSGTIDLGALQRQLRDLVDFGAVELAGQGTLSGHYKRVGPQFEGGVNSELHGLHVAGLATGPLQRELVGLDLDLGGQTRASGLPRTLDTARLRLTSGETSVDVMTNTSQDTRVVNLTAESPLPGTKPPRRARGRLDAQWGPAGVSIDRLALSILAGAAERDEEQILLDAKGTYDRNAGVVLLTPAGPPPGPATAFAMVPEGLQISGLGGKGPLRASAGFHGDLGALRQLVVPRSDEEDGPVAAGRLSGPWSARATVESGEDGLRLIAKVDLQPMSASTLSKEDADAQAEEEPLRDEGPVSVSLNVLRPTGTNRLDVAEIGLASRYATVEGSGRLSQDDAQAVDLSGTLTPRWDAINTLLSTRIEPGARVAGKPRAWRIQGSLAGTSVAERLKSLDAEFGLELSEANIYGLRVGPIPLVLRSRSGQLDFETIDTTLNGGRLHLEPRLTLNDEGGVELHLDQRSLISDAEINDEVSRRFLSYVAPVIDRATRAHGRVSVGLKDAEFPIGGAEKREAKVEGKVVFQDVEFLPGPLVAELYGLLGRTDRPSLKLDEPVSLTIADRRVYQKGLTIPVGPVTQVELNGWVDFDRNIQLEASLPITAAMVGNAPVLSALVENQRIRVPIRGTLNDPKIDREAFNLSLKDLGQSILGNGMVRGAAEMLLRFPRARDPNAPPRPTFQERRAERQERRAERRRQRGLEP